MRSLTWSSAKSVSDWARRALTLSLMTKPRNSSSRTAPTSTTVPGRSVEPSRTSSRIRSRRNSSRASSRVEDTITVSVKEVGTKKRLDFVGSAQNAEEAQPPVAATAEGEENSGQE